MASTKKEENWKQGNYSNATLSHINISESEVEQVMKHQSISKPRCPGRNGVIVLKNVKTLSRSLKLIFQT